MMVTVMHDILYVAAEDRFSVEKLDVSFYRITLYYGLDQPNIPQSVEMAYQQLGFEYDL